jgi:beta-carotene 3-hydroxylase
LTPSLPTTTVAAVSFVAMEPVTYLAHRFVMHGFGMGWHRSHHRRRTGRFERNDLFPVVFAGASMVAVAVGFNAPGFELMVPVVAGVGAYGAAYLFVHDLYIHRRIRRFTGHAERLDRLAAAHALHHQFGGEPYGMLFPVVPASLRERAGSVSTGRGPLVAGAGPSAVASGSTPSQVPVDR